ncbi:terminase small subunit [Listeria weihenstephanensis]|uniref:Terminase small subunit n=1 Tax=Listeria weihenstephanensis TaxID=1006155 RepID=A0A841Z4S0_9LIST|nr:terminase small subunit [Listeria weihenstephanensis]MBC1499393.1 terminase small subunit [Listeria weihenstephanensis]
MSKLTIQQQKFADEFIKNGNQTEAYKTAGYKVQSDNAAATSASRLLRNDKVKEYIDERMAEIKSKKIADQQEVMEYLTAVMRGEHKEQTLRGAGEGYQDIDEIDVGASQRIKAAELIGKRYGAWTDKQQIEGDLSLSFNYDYGDGDTDAKNN